MSETDIQRLIQLALSNGATRLWRFPVGNYELIDGRRIQVGVSGMSDLLGITDNGRFVAIEVKAPKAHTKPALLEKQRLFVDTVRRLGGLAGFADSPEDAQRILNGELLNGH
jgi:hypothetical protein